MNSVVLNIAEADGNDPGTAKHAIRLSACGSAKEVRAGLQLIGGLRLRLELNTRVNDVDTALDDCAMSWRLSGR